MASPNDAAATMLRNLPEKTGKSMQAWHAILRKTGKEKHGELMKVLKGEYSVTHGFANLIVMKYREACEAPVTDLVAAQYQGAKHGLRPIYGQLQKEMLAFGSDVELAPKKTYVSLRRKKQFGLIQPSTRTRVDIGLNLPGKKSTKRLEESGSFNAMVSHRVRLSSVDEIDHQLITWLKEAYNNAG